MAKKMSGMAAMLAALAGAGAPQTVQAGTQPEPVVKDLQFGTIIMSRHPEYPELIARGMVLGNAPADAPKGVHLAYMVLPHLDATQPPERTITFVVDALFNNQITRYVLERCTTGGDTDVPLRPTQMTGVPMTVDALSPTNAPASGTRRSSSARKRRTRSAVAVAGASSASRTRTTSHSRPRRPASTMRSGAMPALPGDFTA